MIGDIYSAQVIIGTPKNDANIVLFYRETAEFNQFNLGTEAFANAWASSLPFDFIATMTTECRIAAVVGRKHFDGKEPKWRADISNGVGTVAAPTLPSNNAIVMQLIQSTFPQKSNGRIFLTGIGEGTTTIGLLNDGFINGALNTLRLNLQDELEEDFSGLGRWELGVLSRKVLNASPPAKDWAGAFAPVTNIVTNKVIGTQRRRATPVEAAILA